MGWLILLPVAVPAVGLLWMLLDYALLNPEKW